MRPFHNRFRIARSAAYGTLDTKPDAGASKVDASSAGHPKFLNGETGSAVVEFIALGVLLLVPVVYFVLTVGILQGATYAAAGAADHAAKAFAAAPDVAVAHARAEESVRVVVGDFGMEAGRASFSVTCSRADCLEAGNVVTVSVEIEAPLPLTEAWGQGGPDAGRITARATQVVGRYR
ncbi:hypothetical protein [Sinomonas terrae]|uniref:Pilus assembly protein TadE n=1 Tax=Sinomonas terrae TaxID=2908838 RepID=A0ABS9TZU1_9MICC|nr:hypothetical protein [Sinomonas terrae]MCH6469692.1 hypothetical protein [Sinomonas terrae]